MLALEDEDPEVSAYFERHCSSLVEALDDASKKNIDKIVQEPPSPDVEARAHELLSLIVNYEERLSTERILVKLIIAGETLLRCGLPALALVKCFNRYSQLQFSSQMKLDLGNGRRKPNVNLAPEVNPKAQFGRELCLISIAVKEDPNLKSGKTLKAIMTGLEAIQTTMRDVIKDELEDLLYQGTVHIYLISLYLFRKGFASEVIRPLLWAALSLESLVGMCAPGFLPWKMQLHVLVARCYEEIGKVHAAHAIAERAQAAISRTQQILSLDNVPLRPDAEEALRQSTKLIENLKFKYSLLASIYPEDESDARDSSTSTATAGKKGDGKKPPPKSPKDGKRPDKGSSKKGGKDSGAGAGLAALDTLLEGFASDSARLCAITEALADPARRALRPTVLDSVREPMVQALFEKGLSLVQPYADVITQWLTQPPPGEEMTAEEQEAAAEAAAAEAEAEAAKKDKAGKKGKGARPPSGGKDKGSGKKGGKKGQIEEEAAPVVATLEAYEQALAVVPFDLHVEISQLAMNYGQMDVFKALKPAIDLRIKQESEASNSVLLYRVLVAVHHLRTGTNLSSPTVNKHDDDGDGDDNTGGVRIHDSDAARASALLTTGDPMTVLSDVLTDILTHSASSFPREHPDFLADAALELWGKLDGRFEEHEPALIHPLLAVHRCLIAVDYPDVTLRSMCALHLSHLLEDADLLDQAQIVLQSGIDTLCQYRLSLDIADSEATADVGSSGNTDADDDIKTVRRPISTSLVTDASVIYSEISRQEKDDGGKRKKGTEPRHAPTNTTTTTTTTTTATATATTRGAKGKRNTVNVSLYTAASQINQSLLYLHGDMESVLCRVQLKIGVREAEGKHQEKLEKRHRKLEAREAQQAVFGMKTNKDMQKELEQTRNLPPVPQNSPEAERQLLAQARKNQYRKALLYIHMCDFGRSRPERTALLEQAAAALEAATQMEVQHVRDLQSDLTIRDAAKDGSRAPVPVARGPHTVLFQVPSFNVAGRKVHTVCYYGKPAGVGTLVTTAHSELGGTGVPVEPGSRTAISGLAPNETYVFAVTGHDPAGERLGDISRISSEVVALQPLPLLYLWSQLAYTAFHGGCFAVAKRAAQVVCREFIVPRPKAPEPEDNPLTAYQVVLDRVADAPLPLLRAVVQVIFLLVDIDTLNVKEKGAYDNYTTPRLATESSGEFNNRMLQANRLLLAVQISAAIPHEGLLSQAVSKLYQHIIPMLRTTQHQPLLLHVAIQCLSAFRNTPRARQSENMRRILPCLCHEALTILQSINEPKVMKDILSLIELTNRIVNQGVQQGEAIVGDGGKVESVAETEPEKALIEVVLHRGFGLDDDAAKAAAESSGGKGKKDKDGASGGKQGRGGKGDKGDLNAAAEALSDPDAISRTLLPIMRDDASRAWQQLQAYREHNTRYLEFAVRIIKEAVTQGVEDDEVGQMVNDALTWADARTAEYRAVFANPAEAAAAAHGEGDKKDGKGKKGGDKDKKGGGGKDTGDKGKKKKKGKEGDVPDEDEEKARLEEEQREREEAAATLLQTKLRECMVQKQAARAFRKEVSEHRLWRAELHALDGLRQSGKIASQAPTQIRFRSHVVVDSHGRLHYDDSIPVYPRPQREPKVERVVEEEPKGGKKGKKDDAGKKGAKKTAVVAEEEAEAEEEAVYDPYKNFAPQLSVLQSYHRAVLLSHRARRFTVSLARMVELWNQNTAFFSDDVERLQMCAPSYRHTAWALIDILTYLRDGNKLDSSFDDDNLDVSLDWSLLDDNSSLRTPRASSTGDDSYAEQEKVWLSGRADIDFSWALRFVEFTLQVLTISGKWQDVIELGTTFDALTNGHEALTILPYVIHATEKQGQDASTYRDTWNETARDQTTIFKSLDRARRLLALYLKNKAGLSGPGDNASVESAERGDGSVATTGQVSRSKVTAAYQAAVELLRARRERDSLLPALLELGDLYYSTADIPNAREAWNDGIDQAFRVNNAAKQWRQLVNLASDLGLWNLYLVACMADRLAQITPCSQQQTVLDYYLLSATVIKTSFGVSGSHPSRDCDFANYTLRELYPGLALFSDPQKCDPNSLIDMLDHTCCHLIDNGHALEALPVCVLYIHLAADIMQDLDRYTRASILKARALVRAGYMSACVRTLRDLMFAQGLPQAENTARIPTPELQHDLTAIQYHDHLEPEDSANQETITFLAETAMPEPLVILYGAVNCADFELVRAEWLVKLADTEVLLPSEDEAGDAGGATGASTGKGGKAGKGKDKDKDSGKDASDKKGGGKGKGKNQAAAPGQLDLSNATGIEYYLTAAQHWLSQLKRQYTLGSGDDEDGTEDKKDKKSKKDAGKGKKKVATTDITPEDEEEGEGGAVAKEPPHYTFHSLKVITLAELALANIELCRSRLTVAHTMIAHALTTYTAESALANEHDEICTIRDHLDINYWSEARLSLVHILARQEQLDLWEIEGRALVDDTARHQQHDLNGRARRYQAELLVEQGSPADGLALLKSTVSSLRSAPYAVPSFADTLAATAELHFQLGEWNEACSLFQEAHDLLMAQYIRQGGHLHTELSPLESIYLPATPTLLRLKVRLLQIKSAFTDEFKDDLADECALTTRLASKTVHPHPVTLSTLYLVCARVARINLCRRYCGLPWGSLSNVTITTKALQRAHCPDEVFDNVVEMLHRALRFAIRSSHNTQRINDVLQELIDLYGSNIYPGRIAEHLQYALHYIGLMRQLQTKKEAFNDLRALSQEPLPSSIDVPEFAVIEIRETDEHNSRQRLAAPEPVDPVDGKPVKGGGKDDKKKGGGAGGKGKAGRDDDDLDGITSHKLLSYFLSLLEDSRYAPFSDMVIHTQCLKIHQTLLNYPPYANLCSTAVDFGLPDLPLRAMPAWQVQSCWSAASDDTLRLTYVVSPGDPSEPTPDQILDQTEAEAAAAAAEAAQAAQGAGDGKKKGKGGASAAKKSTAKDTGGKKGGKKDGKGKKGEIEEEVSDIPDAVSTQAGRTTISESGCLRLHQALDKACHEYRAMQSAARDEQASAGETDAGDDEDRTLPRIRPAAMNTLRPIAQQLCTLFRPNIEIDDVAEQVEEILSMLHPTSLTDLLAHFDGRASSASRNRYTCTLLMYLLPLDL